jgi:putative glutamine amidotransferase
MQAQTLKTGTKKPIVIIPTDVKQIGEHPFHAAGNKYVMAVVQGANAMPLLVPAIANMDIDALLNMAHGILLTGSPSNVHPAHFDESVRNPALPLDTARDTLTLKLIPAAIRTGVPLLAICRGCQELNVAFGGSLHQAVHEVASMQDHREPKELPIDVQYAPSHPINIVPNGFLAGIVQNQHMQVNSLHGQGINRLGLGLRAEAHAPDGLIEAVSVEGARAFALGVQWHPEWKVMDNPAYLAIFNAFGQACELRMLASGEP